MKAPCPPPPDSKPEPKERPYLRSVKQISGEGGKPRFRLVKIDKEGRRKQFTVSVVSSSVLPFVEKEFLRS